ncbi:hypothetical protein HZY83_00425 [Gemella sp. GH3]|uniref:hypothetical protein n=1 Tax=unclassified Gemella TaxID=2624949 RepID=UPI0015CFABAC|nr:MULTISPECIES: hypothetical protein [unclassified Gemella]MBF0713175.1 hypothetical protein [Gemella sp. GH3.1]NYS50127.1 hypothetical protein [Gemella sp. GH3]
MKKKNIFIAGAIAASIAGAGGAYYGYTYYNDPVLKIARAEAETVEKISAYTNERLKEDISWFDKNAGKEKSLTIKSNTESADIAVTMYQNPKENKGFISAEASNPTNKEQRINLSFYDKGNDAIVVDSNLSDYAISIPEKFIKEQLKYPLAQTQNSLDSSYIDSIDISVNEITKIFIPDKNTSDFQLNNSDVIEILKTLPKEAITKKDDIYTVTLNKERIDNLASKYEEIATKKAKTEFSKKYVQEYVKNVKENTSKLKDDIKIDYKITKEEVTRTIHYKDNTIKTKPKDMKLEIKSNISKEKLSFNLTNESNDTVQYVSEKTGDNSYKDTLTYNGEQKINVDTKKSGNSTATNIKIPDMVGSPYSNMELKTTVQDSTLTYELSDSSNMKLVTLIYSNNPTKPSETTKEIKDLAGKNSSDQQMILAEFVQKIMIKLLSDEMNE